MLLELRSERDEHGSKRVRAGSGGGGTNLVFGIEHHGCCVGYSDDVVVAHSWVSG